MSPLPQAYQLRISLVDSEPEIWRQVLVEPQCPLEDLHRVIQLAMGWEDKHEYAFDVGLAEKRSRLANTQPLAEVIKSDTPLYYTYDFESGWLHRITLESIEAKAANDLEASHQLPTCTDGAGACPPEDTGGVWGYDDFHARLEDTSAPDYITLIEKHSDFDPDEFDVNAAAARLNA